MSSSLIKERQVTRYFVHYERGLVKFHRGYASLKDAQRRLAKLTIKYLLNNDSCCGELDFRFEKDKELVINCIIEMFKRGVDINTITEDDVKSNCGVDFEEAPFYCPCVEIGPDWSGFLEGYNNVSKDYEGQEDIVPF